MATVAQVIPDLLNRQDTLALGGVARPYSNKEESARIAAQILSIDGVYVDPNEAPVAYGDKTRQEVLDSLKVSKQSWVYLYGGWNNGMTLQANFLFSLPGNIPLNQWKVKDMKVGLGNSDRPRIYFDYRSDYDRLSGWNDMLKLKGIQVTQEEYEEMTIAHLLLGVGGAPTRWSIMVSLPGGEEPLLPPTTSSPFPGAQYGHGFIVSYLKPVFAEGPFPKFICNTTGARTPDSIGLANLMVRFRHDAQTAREVYIADAARRLEKMEKEGAKKFPFTRENAEKYAPAFVESQEPVVEDVQRILANWRDEEVEGFQYAAIVVSDRMLATAVYRIPRSRPYCWVKTSAKGWEPAV